MGRPDGPTPATNQPETARSLRRVDTSSRDRIRSNVPFSLPSLRRQQRQRLTSASVIPTRRLTGGGRGPAENAFFLLVYGAAPMRALEDDCLFLFVLPLYTSPMIFLFHCSAAKQENPTTDKNRSMQNRARFQSIVFWLCCSDTHMHTHVSRSWQLPYHTNWHLHLQCFSVLSSRPLG